MLELRPTCEHCNTALPADSPEARICSYECTFCAHCAETVLSQICPNCGGGFVPRPIRPAKNRQGGNFLDQHPASIRVVHKPVELEAHAALVASLEGVPPEAR